MADSNQSITIINYTAKHPQIQSNRNHSHQMRHNRNSPERYLNISLLPEQFISQQIHQSPLVKFNNRLVKCLNEKAILNFRHSLQKQKRIKPVQESLFNKRSNRYKKLTVQESKINETAFSLQMVTTRQFKINKKMSLIQRRSSQKKAMCKIPCINYPILNEKQRKKIKRNILTKEQQMTGNELIEQIFSKNLMKEPNKYQEYHVFKRYSYQAQHPYTSLIKHKIGTEPLEEEYQQVVDNSFFKAKRNKIMEAKDDFRDKYNSTRFISRRYDNDNCQYKENSIKKIQAGPKFNKFGSHKKVAEIGDENQQFGPWAQNSKEID